LNIITSNTTDKFKQPGQFFLFVFFLATGWVVGVAVGVPMGFIIILLVVIIIMLLVRRSSGTESEEKRTQPSNEYEEVGLTPTSSKNKGVAQDVPAQSAESEEKRAQSNPEYEEVGLRPTSSKNQDATHVPAQSTEYETTTFQATSNDHVYERVTKQMKQACYENTSIIRNKV